MTELDWNKLTFDCPRDETLAAITDEDWQILRKSLKGQSLELKHAALTHWISSTQNVVAKRRRQLQAGNYVNALRRAGHIPPRNHE